MKRYIFFDLDGTLTDPMLGITSSVQYALAKFGISVRYLKELIPFIGPPLAESFRQFYGFSGEQAQEAVKYYREYFAPKGIFENEKTCIMQALNWRSPPQNRGCTRSGFCGTLA